MNKYTVLAAVAVLIVGFQNCSNTTSFDASGSLIAKSGVNDTTGNIDVPADVPADVGNNDGAVLPVPPPTTPPTPGTQPPSYPPVVDRDHDRDHDHDVDHDDDDDGKECANRGPGNGGGHSDDDDDKKDPKAASLVACILEGPGSSVKVALNRAGLSGQHSASESVCMSERACLTVVSKILPVKSAEKRGYCGHNPNVLSMTDAEVEAAVNQELLSKMVSSR